MPKSLNLAFKLLSNKIYFLFFAKKKKKKKKKHSKALDFHGRLILFYRLTALTPIRIAS